jgi:hypothetical protein
MSEVDEATGAMGRQLASMASAAIGVAKLAQRARAERARHAAQQAEAQQAQAARQLAAERELAATGWARADDAEWMAAEPGQVAQAWASAAAWEPVDGRAAAARQAFEDRLRDYGADIPTEAAADEAGDFTALAMMLQRGAEHHLDVAAGDRDDARHDTRGAEAEGLDPAGSGERRPAGEHSRDAGVSIEDAADDLAGADTALGAAERTSESVVDPQAASYQAGGEPARLAGQSYPQSAAAAIAAAQARGRRAGPRGRRAQTARRPDRARDRDR